jgi:hypothetical protein
MVPPEVVVLLPLLAVAALAVMVALVLPLPGLLVEG